MNNTLVVARAEGGRTSCGYKRATWMIFMVMEVFCILNVSRSISCLWHCTVLQDVIIGKNWVNVAHNLSVSFLTTKCSSIIISKKNVYLKGKKKKKKCSYIVHAWIEHQIFLRITFVLINVQTLYKVNHNSLKWVLQIDKM